MQFREAKRADVIEIVKLLADDQLGMLREEFSTPIPQSYYTAFENIDRDPNQDLIVVVDDNERVIGTVQLSFLQYLAYQGGTRVLVESVRVSRDMRGQGIGRAIFGWVIERARKRGAHLIQLTTDKKRSDAIRFYESLGFKASHEGMKMHLSD